MSTVLSAGVQTARHMRGNRLVIWASSLIAMLLISSCASLWVGSVPLSAGQIAKVLSYHLMAEDGSSPAKVADTIIWQVRLPRLLLAVSVGAGLAMCGVVIQAMVRNVLAEPYILGINSGASTGAAVAILLGTGTSLIGQYALQGMAFVGGTLACALVFVIAYTSGRFTSLRLLLSGVAVGYALNALTSFLIFAAGDAEGARSVMFWLLGSLSLASWGVPLASATSVTVLTFLMCLMLSRSLDVLALGDDTAVTMGVSAHRLRMILLLLVSLCTGVLVSASGSIGFIGLVVPHLARKCVGEGFAKVLPVSALMGAILMVLADVMARTLLAPQEIPIGVLTALVGAPFLVVLVRSSRSEGA